MCLLYIEQPFCDISYTLFNKWWYVEVRITRLLMLVTVPAGATTGTVSVPTTADTIDEVELSALLMELSATGTIIDTMRLLWQRSLLLRLPKDWCVFDFTLSNPSAVDTSYTFVLTNGTAGSGLHDYCDSNCSCWKLLERYRYQQLRIQLMKWTNFQHC
jgi:hypothetical protein